MDDIKYRGAPKKVSLFELVSFDFYVAMDKPRKDLRFVHALAIDIFGTVVDWRGSIIKEGERLKQSVEWPQFADNWLAGYRSRVEEVRAGRRLWANLDVLLAE